MLKIGDFSRLSRVSVATQTWECGGNVVPVAWATSRHRSKDRSCPTTPRTPLVPNKRRLLTGNFSPLCLGLLYHGVT